MIKVKICGIHSINEARSAVKSGADYLGLLINIPKTNLSNTIKEAATIVYSLKKVRFIILTIEQDPATLLEMVRKISPWGIQLLRPTIKNVRYLHLNSKVKVIPVVHVSGSGILKKARSFYIADFILLDSKSKGQLGGTGKTHNWTLSKKIIEQSPIPILLAGGLGELNVKEAIKQTIPYGVDAESLLRNPLGFRDSKKVKGFIKQAKHTN